MTSKRLRLFLDTSALIAGLLSSKGAAREVLRLGEAEIVEIVISKQVVVEAERVLGKKFPTLMDSLHSFLKNLNPTIVPDPKRNQIEKAMEWIHKDDAPILAAALEADVDYLISWNTRHFMKKSVLENVPFSVNVPGDFLEDFRKMLS